jgi:16S rRNA (guanine(966)-N(2))-methyltransferase RsmD
MNNKSLTTQIIAGKHKGKKLQLPSLDVTRSSKARLKESFFNVLQFDVVDSNFIEAFAGSGSIGLEAVSRGAKISYFVEKDKDSYTILLKNCKMIDMNRCQTFLANTFKQMPLLLDSLKNNTQDIIIYIDPPFDFREGMESIYERCFEMVKAIENDNIYLICFEHFSNITMPQNLGKFEQFKYKKFGKSALSYYKMRA